MTPDRRSPLGMQVFDGRLSVAFSQAYVASRNEDREPDISVYFRGQRNGLLGAAKDGILFLTVGADANGEVGMTVQVVEVEPALDDSWEECVEASFSPASPTVALFDWDGLVVCEIPLGKEMYRVRYTAQGMDARFEDTDTYGLWFWPHAASADVVIRQTSKKAAYWHEAWTREAK